MVFKLDLPQTVEPHMDVCTEVIIFFAGLISDWNIDCANTTEALLGQKIGYW